MTKTVLLTGVTGYIAKHVALQLLQAGYHVRGSMRDPARGAEVMEALRPHLADSDLQARLRFVALDLGSDAGWDAAIDGVDVLVHTASPFPMTQPQDETELTSPAVDGTLRALRAAQAAGVKRVVLTSSTAAISGSPLPAGDSAFDETNWTDPSHPDANPYVRSKTLAERAAWDFVRDAAPEMNLTTINPGMVLGEPLDSNFGTSVAVIERMLRAKDPMLPDSGFSVVDVQDVAELHVCVIDRPDTYGQRIMAVDRFMTFKDIAVAIKTAFPNQKIVSRVAPNIFIRLVAMFDASVRSILPGLGRIDKMDNTRARETLGRGLRQAPKAAVATAGYLIENGRV